VIIKVLNRICSSMFTNKRGRFATDDFEFFPDDVFLVSYPKSGNTWLRFIIGNYLTDNKCDFMNSHLIIPDVHLNPEHCRTLSRPRFIKSHSMFTPKYKRVVYLVRNGFDVAVSYYFHLMKHRQISRETSFETYIDSFNAGIDKKFGTWSSNVLSWLDNSPREFLLVKYEDMKLDTASEIKRILDFAGLEIKHDTLLSAINSSSLENMKNLEKSQTENNPISQFANSDRSISFVRTGQVGEGNKFFSKTLRSQFIKIHRGALERMGYL
jgi:hypothetical protein